MKLGMVGLGRMGGDMARRLIRGGHDVVVFDPRDEAIEELVGEGAEGSATLSALVEELEVPRAVWVMVPAGDVTGGVLGSLAELLGEGDTVIDGGNSFYGDTMERARALSDRGIALVDVGTSGGVWGLTEGYSLMVGGPEDAARRLTPAFETLAPARDRGWGYVGPSGAGHFVKMVHNGVEYGMMEAIAEGFELLHAKEPFELDLAEVAEIWRYGSVVRSWLLDLAAAALEDDGGLEGIRGWVSDSGEGRWTVKEAVDLGVPAPVITLALQRRFRSRSDDPFAERLLAALRNEFGGHAVKGRDENEAKERS
jgi:6-phosphogluconate dehydrogenase